MVKKKKLTKKEYIDIKIANCDQLIQTAISIAQSNIYEGYRKFWIDQLTEKKTIKEVTEPTKIESKLEDTLSNIEELRKLLPKPGD